MWNIGDTVKVIDRTLCGGIKTEVIPIGTVCVIVEIDHEDDGKAYYGLIEGTKIPKIPDDPWYYLEEELERGRLVWIKD